jgi:hypothetical protein
MAIVPSDTYPGQTDVSDTAGYPYGAAQNVTVAGDGTGFPMEKTWVNDVFGFLQALLVDAGITPSGDPDEANASQYLQAIHEMQMPAMNRMPFHNVRSYYALPNNSTSTNYAVLWRTTPLGDAWFVYTDSGDSGEELYRSRNGYDWLPTSTNVATAIDAASSDTAIVLAIGSVSVGLARSTNGTVFAAPTVTDLEYVTIFYTGATFIASADGAIRRSTDDGATFVAPTSLGAGWSGGGYEAAQFAIGDGRIVAVPATGAFFIYSDDEGDNWSQVAVPNKSWKGIAYANGTWVAITDESGGSVYKSTDNGATWVQQTTTALDADGLEFQKKIFSHGKYFAGLRGGSTRIWYSQDGALWVPGPELQPATAPVFRAWQYGGGGFCLAYHDANGDTELVTTLQNP